MLLSLALVFLCGMLLGSLLEKMGVPRLLGMLVTGILLGLFGLDLLDGSTLEISGELRQVALIITLARTRLNLDVEDLRKMGRPVVLMCFVLTCFEIAGVVLLAPALPELTRLEAAVMGTAVAAMSPAVIVPRMLKLIEEGYGEERSVPRMIMAEASMDNASVIVLLTALAGLEKSGSLSAFGFLAIPALIVLGLVGDVLVGLTFSVLFKKMHMKDSGKMVPTLSVTFLLVTLEHDMNGAVEFSKLLAVMVMEVALQRRKHDVSRCLSQKLSKLWVGAEILLSVLVGITMNAGYAWETGAMVVVLTLDVLVFRIAGVLLYLVRTPFSRKERAFSVITCPPRATVRVAIGGLPLSMELTCRDIVLTVVVLSVLITAPLDAALIGCNYKKLLQKAGQIPMADNSRSESRYPALPEPRRWPGSR